VTVGAVSSTLIPFTVAVAELPARSDTVPLALWLPPSVSITGAGQASGANPDPLSVHVKVTVTLLEFQPLAFGAGEAVAVIVGRVSSMLIPLTVAVAELPALSTAVPLALWFAPSVVSVTGAGQVSIPDPPGLSAHEKVTITLLEFQPLAFGAGEAVAVIVGAVLSMVYEGPVNVPVSGPPTLSSMPADVLRLSPSDPSAPVLAVTV
jgi:hypothetical protein